MGRFALEEIAFCVQEPFAEFFAAEPTPIEYTVPNLRGLNPICIYIWYGETREGELRADL